MKLNHLNLCVPNLADAITFYETFYGFRCLETKGRDTLAVLEGEGGFTLVLSNFHKDIAPVYPNDFHIGFIVDSAEQVQHMYDRLIAAGYEIPTPPRSVHGSLGFYLHAPGQILVEVSCPLS